MSQLESGARRPSEKVIVHIAQTLGVDKEELISGKPTSLEPELLLTLHDVRRDIHANRHDSVEKQIASVVKQAGRYGLPRIEAKAHEAMGALWERRGDLNAALQSYNEAEDRWRDEPIHLRYEAVCGVARCTQLLGDPRLAIHILETYILRLNQERLPDPTAIMRANSSLVAAYFASGLPGEASKAASRALELQPRIDDAEQVACMNINVARSLLYQGQVDDALEALRTAERSYTALEWKHDVAQAKIARGIILAEKEDLDGSRDALTEAVAILVDGPNTLDYVRAVNELARVERRRGETISALELLEAIAELISESDLLEQATWKREYALTTYRDDPRRAQDLLLSAAHLYRTAGARTEVATTLRHVAELLEEQGDIVGSLEAYREAIMAIEERQH